jgi:hypothetical protein
LPPEFALPVCPMRVAQEPTVMRLVGLFARCERYRTLPRKGGIWAQPARVLAAFDVMRAARDVMRRQQQEARTRG